MIDSSIVFIVNTLQNEGFFKNKDTGKWEYRDNGREFDTLMDAYEYYLFEL